LPHGGRDYWPKKCDWRYKGLSSSSSVNSLSISRQSIGRHIYVSHCFGRRSHPSWLSVRCAKIFLHAKPEHICETRGQLIYEWEHLKSKLRIRAPEIYSQIQNSVGLAHTHFLRSFRVQYAIGKNSDRNRRMYEKSISEPINPLAKVITSAFKKSVLLSHILCAHI
jgi:hypothetical protein